MRGQRGTLSVHALGYVNSTEVIYLLALERNGVLKANLDLMWLMSINIAESFGARGALGSNFAGYVLLASQNPYPIIVYSVAIYRPHLSHFGLHIFLFLNPCLPEFSYPRNPENVRPHSSNATKM